MTDILQKIENEQDYLSCFSTYNLNLKRDFMKI